MLSARRSESASLHSSSRRLCGDLRVGVSMNNPPSVGVAAKHHRHPKIESGLLSPPRYPKTDPLGLHDICEIDIDCAPDLVSAACALRDLRARPIEPRSNFIPTGLHAAETAAETDLVTVRPQRLECSGSALREFMFCGIKLRDERDPFAIGQPVIRHNETPTASSLAACLSGRF